MAGYWAKCEHRCDNLDCRLPSRGLQRFWREERQSDPNRPETAYAILICEDCMLRAMADAWSELEELPTIAMHPDQPFGICRGRTEGERVRVGPDDFKRCCALALSKSGSPLQLKTERALLRREQTKVARSNKERAA